MYYNSYNNLVGVVHDFQMRNHLASGPGTWGGRPGIWSPCHHHHHFQFVHKLHTSFCHLAPACFFIISCLWQPSSSTSFSPPVLLNSRVSSARKPLLAEVPNTELPEHIVLNLGRAFINLLFTDLLPHQAVGFLKGRDPVLMSLCFPASYRAWGIENLAKACLFALICLICSSPVPSVLQSYQPFCYSFLCVPYPFLPDGHGAFCALGVEYCPVTLHMASNPHSPLK